MQFKDFLAAALRREGVNQSKLASMMGVTSGTISKWILGSVIPGADRFRLLKINLRLCVSAEAAWKAEAAAAAARRIRHNAEQPTDVRPPAPKPPAWLESRLTAAARLARAELARSPQTTANFRARAALADNLRPFCDRIKIENFVVRLDGTMAASGYAVKGGVEYAWEV